MIHFNVITSNVIHSNDYVQRLVVCFYTAVCTVQMKATVKTERERERETINCGLDFLLCTAQRIEQIWLIYVMIGTNVILNVKFIIIVDNSNFAVDTAG